MSALAVVDEQTGEVLQRHLNGVAELNAALAKAQAEFPPIKRDKNVNVKTKDGGSYSYSYAPLDAIFEAVRKPLSDHGLSLIQLLDGEGIRTELRHEAGGVIGATFPLPHVPEKPQELGSMLTYLRRYGVVAILGIAPEEDDDGAAAQRSESTGETRSPAQNRKVFALIKDLETLNAKPWPPHPDWKTAIEARCSELWNHSLGTITKPEASTLIEDMTAYVKQLTENPPQAESGFQAPEGAQSTLANLDDDIPF